MKELLEILGYEARALTEAFAKASVQGKGTAQEVAEFRENCLRDFISRYFPFPYKIGKGNIRDANGRSSDSIDLVICNPVHPHTIDVFGKHTLLLADGVDVAIELKPDLSKRSELVRGLEQGISVRRLRRSKSPLLFPRQHSERSLELSTQVPYFLFCTKVKADVSKTVGEIYDYYKDNNVEAQHQISGVFILGKGTLLNVRFDDEYPYSAPFNGERSAGWYFEESGENSLAGILYKLNCLRPCVPLTAEPIMRRYLTPVYWKVSKFVTKVD